MKKNILNFFGDKDRQSREIENKDLENKFQESITNNKFTNDANYKNIQKVEYEEQYDWLMDFALSNLVVF